MSSSLSIIVLCLLGAAKAGHHLGGSSYSVVTRHEIPHHSSYPIPSISHGHPPIVEHKQYEPTHYPKYTFDYGVKDTHTGDEKSQWENRDGDQVKGGYTLKEADGTTRVVEYTADDHSGFNAIVKSIGQAYHPIVQQNVGGHGHSYDQGYGSASSYANVKQHI